MATGVEPPHEQLALVREQVRRARPRPVDPPAADRPVARVAVDVALAHLDRAFDYVVTEPQSAAAVPGARVRVRFAGRDVDGFVLERVDSSEHSGRLERIRRVVSPEPVLAPDVARLARAVADRYAGTLADVLRLAVPPRHAAVEAEGVGAEGVGAQGVGADGVNADGVNADGVDADGVDAADAAAGAGEAAGVGAEHVAPEQAIPADAFGVGPDAVRDAAAGSVVALPPVPEPGPWSRYVDGPSYLAAVAAGGAPRAVWAARPGDDWPQEIAVAVQAALAGGRGALVVVPDARDVARVDAALAEMLGPGRHVSLTAALGPAERYRRFLALRRGRAQAVVGTRAAAFAPVRRLGLVVCWDDGDESLAEQRAPYPHAREVCLLRAAHGDSPGPADAVPAPALLLGGRTVTAEGMQLVESGWARALAAPRAEVRAAAPRVRTAADGPRADDPLAAAARIPSSAWRAASAALERGPVLVQVPRVGYVPALACSRCRTPARCLHCSGPLALRAGGSVPACRWCGRGGPGWRCAECGADRPRAIVVGAARTAEELGRAFPRARVRQSSGDKPLLRVADRPALVVATPGAEPVADGGYAAALLLDPVALLARPDLRAEEEALRRWTAAAALVRPAAEGGEVVLCGDPGLPGVQALVRWDPFGAAAAQLAERAPLGLPPVARVATVTGPLAAVATVLADVRRTLDGAGVTGVDLGVPVEAELTRRPAGRAGPPPADEPPVARAVVRAPRAAGAALASALATAQALRSARRDSEPVRVRVDPLDLG
ncbi:primosomal protein N' family DNA-binding protein [Motilibacter deserti]|uniref:primosomal protein N' family DNA-binding protein n=1 Tax=Motilibacter deserti TaxID=2714956 RepID=UPI0038B40299